MQLLLVLVILIFLFSKKTSLVSGVPSQIASAFNVLQNSEYKDLTYYASAISKMETAKWNMQKSIALRNGYNLFGMSVAKVRPTTNLGQAAGSQFAGYSGYPSSVQDFLLYLRYFNYPKKFNSLEDFVKYMGTVGYYGEETPASYYGKVVAWLNK
jgi:hypothetical protein